MLIIGLAGGIASGKSFVAECFHQLGAEVIDADRVGHSVLEDSGIRNLIEERWGQDVFTHQEIDRRKLAKIVFDPVFGSDELVALEKITHPVIRQRIETQFEHLRRGRETPAVVLDAPVMFRAGWENLCDRIVFIDTDLEQRQQRVAARGWADDELQRREQKQLPIEQKRALSTDTIDNSGSPQATRDQVRELWLSWQLPVPA